VTETAHREVAADLKTIYQSATVLKRKRVFATKWDEKYPAIV
jgi:hypothetical protein